MIRRVLSAVVAGAVALTTVVAIPGPAGAAPGDTAYTFVEQKFDGTTFPGTGWSTTGSWARQCTPVPPGGGCSAVATTTSADYTRSDLSFTPSTLLPADLQDVQLTFTEAANLDVQNDTLRVYSTPPGQNPAFNDLQNQFDATDPDGDGTKVTSTPTTYTVPLTGSLAFPLIFRWQSLGAPDGSPARTWSLSDIKITGTLPATAYTLSADPISNTAYPSVTAGTPRTITLSGSSAPAGDTLNFAIAGQPTIGSFGAVTPVDATHAKVTYTTGVTDCPDPTGFAGYLCTVQFTYTASDAHGNVSAPATGVIDLHPGGAGGVPVSINAPPATTYSAMTQGGVPTQAGDLSGVVQLGPSGYPDAVEVHLRASEGTIHLPNADASGVTYVNGTANDQTQVQFRGPINKVNQALGVFVYLPPAGTTPDATIDIYAADLGATGQSGFLNPTHQAITITTQTVTPRPALTLPSGPLSVAGTAGPLTFPSGAATGISVSDGGATSSTGDTVRLSVTAGRLGLPAVDTTGPSPLVTVSDTGGTFSITGTVAQLNTALADLTYDPAGVTQSPVTLSGFVYNPDSGLTSPTATASITVVQGPSLYGTSSAGGLAGTPLTVFLCGRGPSGAQLSYAVTSGPAHGTFVADPSASAATSGCSVNPGTLVSGYTYTSASGFSGVDHIAYAITDATTGLSAAGTLDITIGAHLTPAADDATGSTRQDSPADVTVCALNPDPQPAPLVFQLTSQGTAGTATPKGLATVNPCADPNQTAFVFTYTPAPGAFTVDGTDTFRYRVSNGAVSRVATVTMTVTTRTPIIAVQPLTVAENGSLGFLICATQPNGPLTFTIGNPSRGVLDTGTATTFAPNCPQGYYAQNYLRYVPAKYFSGVDTISARVTDGSYTSATMTLPIVVTFVEIPATADDQSLTVLSGHTAPVTLTGRSVHGLPLTYRVVSGPAHGTLSGTAPNLVYTPSTGDGMFTDGTDSFAYVANDGTADGTPATVQIRVTTPALASSVCLPGTVELHPDEFACAGTLATGPGGAPLAPTDGTRSARLRLQTRIVNNSAAADDVVLTGTPGSTGTTPRGTWGVEYAVAGNGVTGDLTGGGLTVHLEPGAAVSVLTVVYAPLGFEGASSFPVTVRAVSGNATSVSTAQSVRVTDGASTPVFGAAQADGTGTVLWPVMLSVAPVLYLGGGAGSARLVPSISGAGHNSYLVRGEALPSTSDAAVTVKRGTVDVTAAVLAGTYTLECYSDIGCTPLTVTFTPGHLGGATTMEFTMTSTIDGRVAYADVGAYVETTVGADLYTTPPRTGYGLVETTPSTQVISTPVQTGHTATQRVILRSTGTVSDTFSLRAATTGTGTVTYTATAPTSDGSGNPVDVTTAIRAGTYRVTLASGEEAEVYATVQAGSATGVDAADVVLTAASQLAKDHTDAYELDFPAYSYRPDVVLTGPDGATIGSGVYDTGTGSTEYGFFPTTLSPRTIKINFVDHGTGPQPAPDSLLVKAPATTADFDLTYQLRDGSTTADVTKQITGAGLTVSLAGGGPALLMSAASDSTARAGRPGYFTVSATSIASGLSDAVQVQLYTQGASQLRFGGLPQAEPADIAAKVRTFKLARTAPFKPAGYSPGVTYGAYPDPSGQKFVYDSTYDNFDLQIFSQNVTATRQSLRFSTATAKDMPDWADLVYRFPYTNQGQSVVAADPLGADGVHPKITVNGADVTAAVLAGTWSTGTMRTNETLDVHISFSPPAGDTRRYLPLRVALVDTDTVTVEDVLNLGLSSGISCNDDGIGQQLLKVGSARLDFRSYDRAQGGVACMQPLSNSYISKAPLVFTSSDDDSLSPRGLWLLPQGGSLLTVDARTLEVTGASVKAYADSALLGPDGKPDATTYQLYNYLGTYANLDWKTRDATNGLAVGDDTALPRSPFPMVTPSPAGYPNNTMQARRYFQVLPSGAPVMVGTMRVNEPWFHGDVNLAMPVDSGYGLVLDYNAPANATASLPGDDSTKTYGFYWNSHKDGSVTQGGCLGLPPALFNLIHVDTSVCILGVTTTFKPIPSDPSVEAKIADITFTLIVVGKEIGEPTFNLQGLNGHIELDPATGKVTSVVAGIDFGVGPVTPCYAEQKARTPGAAVSTLQTLGDLACPTNYFIFKAQVIFQQGGFTSENSTTGYGIKFKGALTFLGLVQLNSVEADISTSPFNFHFADSPIDFSVNAGIPISARITLTGDVGALGFDIGLEGTIAVMNTTIASASGVVSTKGMGICGGLAGVSIGFGQEWAGSPTFYSSGCTTNQFRVTS